VAKRRIVFAGRSRAVNKLAGYPRNHPVADLTQQAGGLKFGENDLGKD
jgi:hypothetical protein